MRSIINLVKTTTLISGIFLSGQAFALEQSVTPGRSNIPLKDLQRFTSVVEHIKNYYVQDEEESALFENAIRGMLSGLDPHSAYLNAEEFQELKVSTSGKFGGIGIEVNIK